MPDQSKVWNPGKNVNAPSRLWLCEDSAEDSLPSYRQGDDISALVSSAKQCPIASPGSEEPKVHCEQIGKDPTDNALSYAPLRVDHSSSNLIRLRNEATALTIIALSLWMIVFLGLTGVVYLLLSLWKENRFGWPLRGIILVHLGRRRLLCRYRSSRWIR